MSSAYESFTAAQKAALSHVLPDPAAWVANVVATHAAHKDDPEWPDDWAQEAIQNKIALTRRKLLEQYGQPGADDVGLLAIVARQDYKTRAQRLADEVPPVPPKSTAAADLHAAIDAATTVAQLKTVLHQIVRARYGE